jgi:membrane protein implicated in regulation of membrane protease activity
MPVFVRYWLFQIPELVAIASLGLALVWLDWLSWPWLAAALAFDVAKDAAMYPWLAPGYRSEPSSMVGPERMIGARGLATELLAPEGFVRVTGELWQARTADGSSIARGAAVEVEAVHGLRLVVRPAPPGLPRTR